MYIIYRSQCASHLALSVTDGLTCWLLESWLDRQVIWISTLLDIIHLHFWMVDFDIFFRSGYIQLFSIRESVGSFFLEGWVNSTKSKTSDINYDFFRSSPSCSAVNWLKVLGGFMVLLWITVTSRATCFCIIFGINICIVSVHQKQHSSLAL